MMTSDTLNKTRIPSPQPQGLWCLAALVVVGSSLGFGVLATAGQDGIRVKNVKSAEFEGAQSDAADFLVRTARVPIFVDIDLGSTGVPRVPDVAADRVITALDDNPRRLITLRFKGAALHFGNLSHGTRQSLLDSRGESVVETYNKYVANQILELTKRVDAERPGSPLAIQGLPVEGGIRASSRVNTAYRQVLDRLNAFVLAGGMMISDGSDEASLLHRAYPQAVAWADGRALMFASNGGWRIATPSASEAETEVVSEEPRSDDLAVGEEEPLVGAAAEDLVGDEPVLGSPGSADVVVDGGPSGASASVDGSNGGSSSVGSGASESPAGGSGGAGGGGGGGGSSSGAAGSTAGDIAGPDPGPETGGVEEDSGGSGQEGLPASDSDGAGSSEGDDDDSSDSDGSGSSEGDDDDSSDSDGAGSSEGDDDDSSDSDGAGSSEGDDDDSSDSDGAGSSEGDDGSDQSDEGDAGNSDDDGWDPDDEVDESDDGGTGGDDSGDGQDESSDDQDDSGDDQSDQGGSDPADGGNGDAEDEGGEDSSSDDPAGSDEDGDSDGGSGGEDEAVMVFGPAVGFGDESVSDWGSFSDLQQLIDMTPDGGELDLTGRGFAYQPGDAAIRIDSRTIDISGGHITGAIPLDWQLEGSGVYSASVDLAQVNDARLFLVDPDAADWPRLAQVPSPPPVRDYARFTYNSRWWEVNNESAGVDHGDVITDDGVNVVGSRIRGVRVTDSEMRDAIDEAVGGSPLGSLTVLYHAGPNLISSDRVAQWNPATGELLFVGINPLTYNRYLRFCMMGSSEFIGSDGEYAIDFDEEKVYYRPNHDAPPRARLSLATQLVRVVGSDVVFRRSTLSGHIGSISGAGMISGDSNAHVTLRECHLHSCDSGLTNIQAEIVGSVIENSSNRGASLRDGSTVTGSLIRHIQNRSGIIIMPPLGTADSPIQRSVVRDCVISMPASAHGQAISLYKDSWQNAVVTHNIFDDCERPIAFQPEGSLPKRRLAEGTFEISNNLFVYDLVADALPGGQSGIAFNGATDEHLPTDGGQNVLIRFNSLLVFTEQVNQDLSYTIATMDLRKLLRSRVRVEGNIAGVITASTLDSEVGSLPHFRASNRFYLDRWGSSYGEWDLVNDDIEGILEASSLAAVASPENAGSDGNPVGIRWSRVPALEDLATLMPGWEDDYPAESLPTEGVGGWVYFNEDRRTD